MNETHYCENCGATLAADAGFCEACGRSVAAPAASAEQLAAPLAAPPAAAPRPANRGLFVGLGIVGVIVVLGCLAVGVFGFWFLQSKPAVPSQLPASTPQVAGMPTRGEPTVGSPNATTQPMQTVATGAPTLMPTLVPGVLFDDDFGSKAASESKGWTFTTNPQVEASWSANQLIMSIKQNDLFIRKFPSVEYEDFGIETEAQFVSGAYADYSLIFRDNRADKGRAFYTFGITTDGRYFLRKTVDDKEVSPRLVDYTSSPLIKMGQSRNTLGVIVKGSRIEMYINRTQVMAVYDGAIKGKGAVGIETWSDQAPATVAFSRFTVYTPEQALATWCPPPAAFPAGVLFEETFSSQRVAACNDWMSLKVDYTNYSWSPNAFTISINKPNAGSINFTRIAGRQYVDFALETEAQPLDDNVNDYGLIFRYSKGADGKQTFYQFGLAPDGRYALGRWVAGEWLGRAVDYTASPLIKTGRNKNILGVIAQGSAFSLYINRTLVKTITDDAIKDSGYAGVTVASGTNVPAAATFSRVTVLTPDKAKAEWGAAPASTQPPSQPSPAVPPGLYVSALRLDPGPKRGVDIAFYPTFLNTTGGTQSYRVRVYLYRAENLRNSFGETSVGSIAIPVGSTEQRVAGSWKLGSGGCEDFIARVGWLDEQNRITFFNTPEGGTFELRFPMCQ